MCRGWGGFVYCVLRVDVVVVVGLDVVDVCCDA